MYVSSASSDRELACQAATTRPIGIIITFVPVLFPSLGTWYTTTMRSAYGYEMGFSST